MSPRDTTPAPAAIGRLAARIHHDHSERGWHDRWRSLHNPAAQRQHLATMLGDIRDRLDQATTALHGVPLAELREGHPSLGGRRVYRVRDGSGADWTTDPNGCTAAPGHLSWTGVQPRRSGLPSALADMLIRILDLAALLGIDLEAAVLDTLDTRPRHHGDDTP